MVRDTTTTHIHEGNKDEAEKKSAAERWSKEAAAQSSVCPAEHNSAL